MPGPRRDPRGSPEDGFVSAADMPRGPAAPDREAPGKRRGSSKASKAGREKAAPASQAKPGFPQGLDERVVDAVKRSGIASLYPPQRQAMEAVLSGRNVMVAVPTASGKSLVAHQSILHTLLNRGGKAIYIVPLRALATEKYEELRELCSLLEGVRLRVALATGDLDEKDTRLGEYDIVVTTSEKADSLIRHGASWFQELSVVVADEVHLIGDGGRGPTLEVTLARLLGLKSDVRLVALSATVGNADEVADWLGATLVQSDWRPVPLREGVFAGDEILFADGKSRELKPGPDAVVRLVADVGEQGGQALVFVSTRRSTEATAKKIAQHVKKTLPEDKQEVLEAAAVRLLSQDGESSRLGERLAAAIRGGAAFHNAGLSSQQRRTVESLFKEGHLRAIVATPTLAAGVNLPARRVVVRDLKRFTVESGSAPLPVLEVKQMTGRAGRPRYDKYGEAVLVSRSMREAERFFEEYLHGEVEPVQSALAQESALRIHLLAGVAAGLTRDRGSVMGFIDATFLARDPYAGAPEVLHPRVEKVLGFLVDEGFIEQSGDGGLVATRFGARVSSLYVDPMSAIMIRDGLAMTRLVKQVEDLALLALVAGTPDVPALWLRRGDEWVEAMAEEGEGRWLRPVPVDPRDQERFLSELKTALLLKDWIEEARLEVLEERYSLGPGDIQNRIQIATWLLYAAEEIARLEGHEVASRLNRLKRRMQAGVREDVLPLLALDGVGRYRARVLNKAGLGSITKLRDVPVSRLLGLRGFGVRVVARLLSQLGRSETVEDVKRIAGGVEGTPGQGAAVKARRAADQGGSDESQEGAVQRSGGKSRGKKPAGARDRAADQEEVSTDAEPRGLARVASEDEGGSLDKRRSGGTSKSGGRKAARDQTKLTSFDGDDEGERNDGTGRDAADYEEDGADA
jgi:helicase